MSDIFHIIGLCPDSFSHWDLIDLLAVSGSDIYFAYFNAYTKFISWFKRN